MTLADIPLWLALPAAVLLVLGGILTVLGTLGLLRLKDFYARLHAPTMGATLGTGCVLIASMLISSGLAGSPRIHELLITVFLVTTAPITTILLMRAAQYRNKERAAEARSAGRDSASEHSEDLP